MAFWLAVAVLAAIVTYAVTRPLAGPRATEIPSSEADLAVYKDQLKEIESDLGRGLISGDEAEAARTEVARRLINVSERAEKPQDGRRFETATPSLLPLYYAASVAVPALALTLYLTFGAPGLPGQPYVERLAAKTDHANADDLVAQVEARLRAHPEDGRGWDVIAPVYMSQGRFGDAANAFSMAAKLLGETVARLEGVALARIRAEDGIVSEDARKALERALVLDPKRTEPRIWLALAKEQDGDVAGALADYRALLELAPSAAPWRQAVESRVAGLAAKPGDGPARAPFIATPEAPSAADAAAVAAMSAGERERLVTSMVEGLASRLKKDGNDLQGWLKLVRAYKVLGRDQDATGALADARKQFSGDAKALDEIDAFAKSLGMGS